MENTQRHIQLMDTTLRDGEQTQGVSFSPAEKVNLAKALLQLLKVDRIEVASARVSQGEKDAVCNINQWAQEQGLGDRIEVLGFVDHTKSVDWILQTGGQVVNLLTKGSEKHCREQLGKTLDQHVSEIHRTVDYALEKAIPLPTITQSLYERFDSRTESRFAHQVIAALRNQFGGHAVRES